MVQVSAEFVWRLLEGYKRSEAVGGRGRVDLLMQLTVTGYWTESTSSHEALTALHSPSSPSGWDRADETNFISARALLNLAFKGTIAAKQLTSMLIPRRHLAAADLSV